MKATVVKGKKPHHFLDYLFLATDREKRMKEAHPEITLINCFEVDNSNTKPSQSSMLNHAPVEQNQQGQQQPKTRCQGESPRKNSNVSKQIFRRGKGQDYKKAELLSKLAGRKRAKESERRVLQEVAPRGIDNTPAGFFDSYDMLGLDDTDMQIFDQVANDFNALPPGALVRGEPPNSVSFESLGDVPFDTSLDDYVLSLIAGV